VKDIEQLLRACRLFGKVEESGWHKITAMAVPKRAEKGAVFFRQGDPCPGIFVVGEGLVRLYNLAPTGKEHVVHMVGPGEAFAEVAAIGGFECPVTAEAVEPSTCVLLPAEAFGRALKEDHSLCLQLLSSMTARVRHFLNLLEDLVLRDSSGRLARFLLDAARGEAREVVLPSLKRHLASHLNLTSETLSRTLRRLTEAGLIEAAGGRKIRVLNEQGLREISEGLFPRL
jgi:CRP/FNR family transcriptional regulator